MRTKNTLLSSSAILAVLLAAGLFYAGNRPAESQQPQDRSFANRSFDRGLYSPEELSPISGMEVAMANCGNDTCSDSQCCCLNTDTGAQCCRPNSAGDCVESCKKSSPC